MPAVSFPKDLLPKKPFPVSSSGTTTAANHQMYLEDKGTHLELSKSERKIRNDRTNLNYLKLCTVWEKWIQFNRLNNEPSLLCGSHSNMANYFSRLLICLLCTIDDMFQWNNNVKTKVILTTFAMEFLIKRMQLLLILRACNEQKTWDNWSLNLQESWSHNHYDNVE